MKKQPYLTDFPLHIFGLIQRKKQAAIRVAREKITRDSLSGYAVLFEHILGSDFLSKIDQTKRQRSYGNIPIFWAWLAQILDQNASCSKAQAMLQSWYQSAGLPVPTGGTGSYCKGRARLNTTFLEEVFEKVSKELIRLEHDQDRWNGMTLKAIDGSSVQLLDTESNQDTYPQPSSQKHGCGFPVMGMMGLVNLSHGGWEGMETSIWSEHDAAVAPKLLHCIKENDLIMADRAFSSYEYIARITTERKAHVLMRLHQARHRKLDWRAGKKIGSNQRLVTWTKPKEQPSKSELSKKQWQALPKEMTMRLIKVGYQDRCGKKRTLVVVTDLLDPNKHDGMELTELYARRWEIEEKLRDVKTTMGMELFSVKSPDMAHKTMLMMMIAYNLIRCLMQSAARDAEVPVRQLSFKGALDLITSSYDHFKSMAKTQKKRAQYRIKIIRIIATKLLNIRRYRNEPRAVKRRPKSYQLLTKSRHIFEQIAHKASYRNLA